MIAPTIDDLYRVEEEVHKALKAVLEDAGIPCYTPRDTAPVKFPYVAARLQLGAATGHLHLRSFTKTQHIDAWNGEIEFQIFTDRDDDEGRIDPAHASWKAAIRRLMQHHVNSFPRSVLPYHSLVKIIEQSTASEIENDQNLDVSEIAFSVVVCIRTDAWP